MSEPAGADFTVAGIACRWQAVPPDTLASARDWLSGLAGEAAAGRLQRDARGRPRLPGGMGDIGWSHSGGRMLLARVGSGSIGVDIEPLGRRVDALRIAERHFADTEIALLRDLDQATRATAFLHLWCAKEAVLKAHGHGIAFGLSRAVFDVADHALRMTACDPALGNPADWRLHAFAPDPAYLAVLATRDGILRA